MSFKNIDHGTFQTNILDFAVPAPGKPMTVKMEFTFSNGSKKTVGKPNTILVSCAFRYCLHLYLKFIILYRKFVLQTFPSHQMLSRTAGQQLSTNVKSTSFWMICSPATRTRYGRTHTKLETQGLPDLNISLFYY